MYPGVACVLHDFMLLFHTLYSNLSPESYLNPSVCLLLF